jgi:hypothetical protein
MSILTFMRRRTHPFLRDGGSRLIGSQIRPGNYEQLVELEDKRKRMEKDQSELLSAALSLESQKAAEAKAQELQKLAPKTPFINWIENTVDSLSEWFLELFGY